MKKTILLLIIVGLLTLTLAGCTTPDVPGSAWAQKEILTYDVLRKVGDTADAEKIGVAVSTLERVSTKAVMKNADNKEFSVSANATHFSMVVTELGTNEVIMESEFIMDGFKPVASYKMVKYGGKDYDYSGVYGAKYVYDYVDRAGGKTVTGGTIGVSGTYMDNEFLYSYIRCYALESINKSITLLSPPDGTSVSVSVKAAQAGKDQLMLPGATEKQEVDVTVVNINRAVTPSGSGISVSYTSYDAATENGNYGTKTNKNYHIPLAIVENDILYRLQDENGIQIFTQK